MPGLLIEDTLETFLDRLASDAPTPGGGSTAALAGALAASLISMVGNLTLGKPRYAAVEGEMTTMVGQSEALRRRLASLIDADARAFDQVSRAMQMPRDTDQARTARTEAVQDALKAAAVVPLQIAEACREVMTLAQQAAAQGNPNVVSDAGVAMLMAESGLRSAALNVLINLRWIKDDDFVQTYDARLRDLVTGSPELREDLYTSVIGGMG
jgi:methenyltetrahydrofolate cyclohydrolase